VKTLRFPVALLVAVGLNVLLFGLLRALITGEGEVATLSAPTKIEFTRLRRSGQVEAIKRAKPKVEKPEQAPSAPALALEQASGSQARAEVAALAAPLGIGAGGGGLIGGILGGGGGGGSGVDRDPVPLIRIDPVYPAQAEKRRQKGWVHVRFTVASTGTVRNCKVVQSTDSVFEPNALRACAQWKYQPALQAGKPVDRDGLEIRVRFEPPKG
jgi:protein TonB